MFWWLGDCLSLVSLSFQDFWDIKVYMFLFCHLPPCSILCYCRSDQIYYRKLFLSFGYRISLIPVAFEIKIWFEKGAKRYFFFF